MAISVSVADVLDVAARGSTGKPSPIARRYWWPSRLNPVLQTAHRNGDRKALSMCRVLNKHHAGVPAGAVYIGRGSKWGNPFRIGPTAIAPPW
jgi:hypothetical protein